MTTTVSAYGATEKWASDTPLTKITIERRDVGPADVAIDIKFVGICHSDVHTVSGDWGKVTFPVVPGHEIAGIVTKVGSEVTRHKTGDRVGVGCYVDSCRECENCRAGEEQYCNNPGMIGTYNRVGRDGNPTQGGYSEAIVVDENYVLRIPDPIALDEAAPLLCAGITTYSPLRRWGAGPSKRIGVIGLGGLGHLGVKLAAAMGADVAVLSRSLTKMEDGLRLGASEYHATSDADTFTKLTGSFDLILNTVSANLAMAEYLGLLKLSGTLIELGMPKNPMPVPAGALIFGRKSISGSLIGGIRETQQMLDFCAEHEIASEIEVVEASYVNEAYRRMLASDVRYRFVIDTASI
jgi:uncharacterized zinc-type alcohol dehydrogenase-like protein